MITSGGVDGHAAYMIPGARSSWPGAHTPDQRVAGIKSGPLTYNRIAIAILIVALLCAYWLGDGGVPSW